MGLQGEIAEEKSITNPCVSVGSLLLKQEERGRVKYGCRGSSTKTQGVLKRKENCKIIFSS